MKRLLPVLAACILMLALVFTVRAGSITAPDTKPGECSPNVTYTQRFQFMPTAFDTNEYLRYITDYAGCDVHISEGYEDGTQRHGFYIWYRLPPLSK